MTTRAILRVLLLAAAAVGAVTLFSRCDEPEPATPAPRTPGAILEVDGVSILRSEFDAFEEFFESWDARLGRKSRARALLTRVLLPRAFARRDFPAERAEQEKRATQLRSVVGNYLELAEIGPAHGGVQPDKPFSRSSLPYSIAAFAFDESNIGAVSQPIETPHGFTLVGVQDIVRGLSTAQDLAHLHVVGFSHQTKDGYHEWWTRVQSTARDKVTFVDPDFIDVLPKWLEP